MVATSAWSLSAAGTAADLPGTRSARCDLLPVAAFWVWNSAVFVKVGVLVVDNTTTNTLN